MRRAPLWRISLPASAEAIPVPGHKDRRVTYATFQDGQVYAITTRLRMVTLMACPEPKMSGPMKPA